MIYKDNRHLVLDIIFFSFLSVYCNFCHNHISRVLKMLREPGAIRKRLTGRLNVDLLKKENYDLEKCIKSQGSTILKYGSEFRSTRKLRNLLEHHEDWQEIKQILDKGCDYKLGPDPEEETRLSDYKHY